MPDTETLYSILSAANLSRMRGNWQAALDKCVEALRLDPTSATAHSLVGDIYADQGKSDEAIQWYQMALDLDPGNAADRSKLDRLKNPVIESPAPSEMPFWARVGVPVAVVLAFVMMSVGLWALFSSHRQESPRTQLTEEPPNMELPQGLRPSERPTHRPSPFAPATPPDASLERWETARELSLHRMLERHLDRSSGLLLFYVQRDPASDDVILSLIYPPQTGNFRPDDLMTLAFNVVGWAFHEDASLHGCTLRLLYRARARAVPDVALTAHTVRNTFESVGNPDTPSAKSLAFERLEWNPFLFPTPPPFKTAPASPPNPASSPSAPALPVNPSAASEAHTTP
jgi:hypothetical protein